MAFARDNGVNATPAVFFNGQRTQVVAPEQLRTLIRQLGERAKAAAPVAEAAPGVAARQRFYDRSRAARTLYNTGL